MVIKIINELLENQAIYNPNKVALIFNGHQWSYYSLNQEANQICSWLLEKSIKPKDRIIIFGKNSDRQVISIFGVLKAQGIFVPVHPETTPSKLEYIIKDCNPAAIIADEDLINKIRVYDGFILNITESGSLKSRTNVYNWQDIYPSTEISSIAKQTTDEIAAIIYTSGSTKDPKGVVEPHKQVLFATNAINQIILNNSNDIIYCGLPLSFDYGLYQIFLAFQVGACIVIADFNFPLSIPGNLQKLHVTGFPGIPSLFGMLLRSGLLERIDLPDLRYITSTGDVFPISYLKQLQKLFPHTLIYPMYGLTECKRVSIVPDGEWERHPGSVGLPLPGTAVFVMDELGNKKAPQTLGELVVKGPHLMNGYWNDDTETNRRFKTDASGERILMTGDYFRIDVEGFLYFEGRNENFIKCKGHRISPLAIESILINIEGVLEAAVVGVPDNLLGESIFAFIYLDRNQDISLTYVKQICKENLSPIECPTQYKITNEPLPKTPNGKLDRKELRRIALYQIS